MAMRIIAGIYRHRLLDYPIDNPSIRPTKDRIREAFFSAIGSVEGLTFLDLCAGSGSMGIEALSRGANESIFVDSSPISLKCIRNNIATLKITNATIINKDALLALEELKNRNKKIDIIYFDPPYESKIYEAAINYIFNNDLLSNNGILAFEANRNIEVNSAYYSKKREYHYGEITVTVLVK